MSEAEPEGPRDTGAALRDLELLARFCDAQASLDPGSLEVEAEAVRIKLSPESAKVFTALLRRRIVPIVAAMIAGVCGECNVAVPTGLASSILTNREVHVCLRCKRVLRPLEDDDKAAGPRETGARR